MKIIYVDLDGVVADFDEGKKSHPLGNISPYIGRPDKLPGIYENLMPIKDSIKSVNKLLTSDLFDVYFLSTAPWDNPKAWMDKRLWVERYLPALKKRLILTHYKDLCCGSENDIIIDDRIVNGVERWNGVHLHFGTEFKNWDEILEYLNV